MEAAKFANAHDFIDSFRAGLDTQVDKYHRDINKIRKYQ